MDKTKPEYLDESIVADIIKVFSLPETSVETTAAGIGTLYKEFLGCTGDAKGLNLAYQLGLLFLTLSGLIASNGRRQEALEFFLANLKHVPGEEEHKDALSDFLAGVQAKSKGEKE